MMNTRGRRLLGAAVCAAGLFLAGCGGDDPPEGGEDSESQGPLAEFFGWDDQDTGEQEVSEEERQQHFEVQDYVVTCMQEAGFEYVPEPFWADREDAQVADDPYQEAWELREEDPEAFAREYGYGATTMDNMRVSEVVPTEDPAATDPNWEYRESLSEAALEEYEKALWGDWEAAEETSGGDGETELSPGEVGGCQNEAYEEVYGFGGEEESEFEQLMERWDTLYQDIESDPRMTDAKATWSACMAEAGYPDLVDLYDGENQVYERQNELYGWDDGSEAAPLPEAEGEDAEEEESEDAEDSEEPAEDAPPTGEPVEPDPAELAELREFELAIAWADFECKRDHDIERIEREVRFEHEERFIEENRPELEAYRDYLNEQGGGR